MTRIWLNFYEHCGQGWTDAWSCQCNDECPVCGHEIVPYDSWALHSVTWYRKDDAELDFPQMLEVYARTPEEAEAICHQRHPGCTTTHIEAVEADDEDSEKE